MPSRIEKRTPDRTHPRKGRMDNKVAMKCNIRNQLRRLPLDAMFASKQEVTTINASQHAQKTDKAFKAHDPKPLSYANPL